jgi:hypothetical protein
MILGTTGSQFGATQVQAAMLASVVRHPSVEVVHHGDCIGVDEFVHLTALDAGKHIVVHPPLDERRRAFCGIRIGLETYEGQVVILPEKDFIPRDDDIVDACVSLVAAPATMAEQLRSGTWTTIRHALKAGKPVKIIYPDGQHTGRIL